MGKQQIIATIMGLLLALGSVANARQGGIIRREEPPPPEREIQRSAVNFSEAWRPDGAAAATRVMGTVIDIRQVPVANAVVQLRNLDTGTVEMTGESDENGAYDFEVEQSGTYVVEMVMADGFIVALSNAGSLARFETLQTVVQLPGRWDASTRAVVTPPSPTSFFGMSAETSMTGATIETAVTRDIAPADPGVPVSPS